MKKGNIIDLLTYLPNEQAKPKKDISISEELKKEIENLINRLREAKPITQSS